MTTVDRVTAPPAAPVPTYLGQATAIEQSRAVAEVQAAVVVAQQRPRSIPAAIAAMKESCAQTALAERAFYRYPRAGQTVTGASVHLARELARCFGNVQYGIGELRRDEAAGYSEMQAWAWDLEQNTRTSTTFVAPHRRDTRDGARSLTDQRDIYESNANLGARRVREMIFAVLPPWYVEQAKELCSKTLRDGGGKPLAQRVADAVALFAELGVTADQLEHRLGRPAGKWTEHDVAQLVVTYRSLQRGEVTRDEEFPPPKVTAEEIQAAGDGKRKGQQASVPTTSDSSGDSSGDEPATRRSSAAVTAAIVASA